jgi:Secretion system C-terminal sorting domain
LYFTGQSRNSSVNLQWKIASNETVQSFEIMRSVDGTNYTSCGTVNGTNRTGEETYTYSEAAASVNKVFYKLKLINKNKATEYSTVITFNINNQKQNFKIVTNPVKDRMILSFNSTKSQVADLKIYNMNGALLKSEKLSLQQGNNLMTLPTGNAISNNGAYIAELNTGEEKFAVKFLKQ